MPAPNPKAAQIDQAAEGGIDGIKKWFTVGNVLAAFAVFLALGGGAFAATQAAKNSVTSKSVKDSAIQGKDVKDDSLTGADVNEATLQLKGGENGPSTPTGPAGGDLTGTYPNPQIAANVVTGDEVKDDSLTGADVKADTLTSADVQESSLSEVPAATLGGLGRYGFTGSCDPETSAFVPCSVVTVNLPNPARMLVIGTALAHVEAGTNREGEGYCQIGTTSGPVEASRDFIRVTENEAFYDNLTVMAITDVFPAGTHSFGIDCNEQASRTGIEYPQARVSAVALSAD